MCVVAMEYEGEITPVEMLTLPDLVSKLAVRNPGCSFRIRSVVQELDKAVVEIAVEDDCGVNLEQLRKDWKRIQALQRKLWNIDPAAK